MTNLYALIAVYFNFMNCNLPIPKWCLSKKGVILEKKTYRDISHRSMCIFWHKNKDFLDHSYLIKVLFDYYLPILQPYSYLKVKINFALLFVGYVCKNFLRHEENAKKVFKLYTIVWIWSRNKSISFDNFW